MVARVAERFVQPLADFSQAQTFKVEQGESLALNLGELSKRFLKSRPVELRPDLTIEICLSR
jgi:hypothetical protein